MTKMSGMVASASAECQLVWVSAGIRPVRIPTFLRNVMMSFLPCGWPFLFAGNSTENQVAPKLSQRLFGFTIYQHVPMLYHTSFDYALYTSPASNSSDKNKFSYEGVALWNSLPTTVQNNSNLLEYNAKCRAISV